jgi:hypothetical protein
MSSSGDVALYELQRPIVEPFLRMFRLTNAAHDFLISDLTFGCAIAEELKDCTYTQALGLLDGLGTLNSWGHLPEHDHWGITAPIRSLLSIRRLQRWRNRQLRAADEISARLLRLRSHRQSKESKMGILRFALLVVSILAILIGLVWVGQGTGYFPYPASSFMINQMPWAYYGAGLAVLGVIGVVVSGRV